MAGGEEVVGGSSSPRLESSWRSHFLVVPSSLRTEEKVESCSCTGRHCRRASLALQGRQTDITVEPPNSGLIGTREVVLSLNGNCTSKCVLYYCVLHLKGWYNKWQYKGHFLLSCSPHSFPPRGIRHIMLS